MHRHVVEGHRVLWRVTEGHCVLLWSDAASTFVPYPPCPRWSCSAARPWAWSRRISATTTPYLRQGRTVPADPMPFCGVQARVVTASTLRLKLLVEHRMVLGSVRRSGAQRHRRESATTVEPPRAWKWWPS